MLKLMVRVEEFSISPKIGTRLSKNTEKVVSGQFRYGIGKKKLNLDRDIICYLLNKYNSDGTIAEILYLYKNIC